MNKKKETVHFTFISGYPGLADCGVDIDVHRDVKTTDCRNRVTCKRCKATKRFRKIK